MSTNAIGRLTVPLLFSRFSLVKKSIGLNPTSKKKEKKLRGRRPSARKMEAEADRIRKSQNSTRKMQLEVDTKLRSVEEREERMEEWPRVLSLAILLVMGLLAELHDMKDRRAAALTSMQEKDASATAALASAQEKLQEVETKATSVKQKDEEVEEALSSARKMETEAGAKLRAVEEREERAAKALQESQEAAERTYLFLPPNMG